MSHEKFAQIEYVYHETGIPLKKVVEQCNVSWGSYWTYINIVHPELRQRHDLMRAGRGHQLADIMVAVVDEEEDPARARVKIEAIEKTIRNADPKSFGNKVDLTVSHQPLDIRDAVERARQALPLSKPLALGLLPSRDLTKPGDGQVIDVEAESPDGHSDKQSRELDDDADPFA